MSQSFQVPGSLLYPIYVIMQMSTLGPQSLQLVYSSRQSLGQKSNLLPEGNRLT